MNKDVMVGLGQQTPHSFTPDFPARVKSMPLAQNPITQDPTVQDPIVQGPSRSAPSTHKKVASTATANLGPNLALGDASHFLGQTTFGSTRADIEQAAQIGINAWLDDQITMPGPSYLTGTTDIWNHFAEGFIETYGLSTLLGDDVENVPFQYEFYWMMAWWQITMTHPAQLRQRVAFALSEIMVISSRSDLVLNAPGLASYYDVLSRHAFGNFKDLLRDVALHPCMGFYLSHLFNQKGDPSVNRRPDENFAREVMQLFSIGLYELNPDGSRKKDAQGRDIPTYDNDDISNMARVFTGLEIAGYTSPWKPQIENWSVRWDRYINDLPQLLDMKTPMNMQEDFHDQDEKILLKTRTLPAGQGGIQDIEDAIDTLFNHPNVGPFIGRQLIQRLVKSNPSPAFVARITAVFNDDGAGTRGNMEAVIRAILTDPEARLRDGTSKKVREPLIRYTQFMRSFKANNMSGRLWNLGFAFDELVGQLPLTSPSVFNFFKPTYAPNGPLLDAGLTAPEFGLHDTNRAVGFLNFALYWFNGPYMMDVFTEVDPNQTGTPNFDAGMKDVDVVSLDLSEEIALAGNPAALVDHLDLVLTGGAFSDQTKDTMIRDMAPFSADPDYMAGYAAYMAFASGEYAVEA